MKRSLLALLAVLSAVLCWSTPAHAAGTVDLYPNQSIDSAVGSLPNGGTIYLHTGTWTAGQYVSNKNPTAEVLITTVDGPVTLAGIGFGNSSNLSLTRVSIGTRIECTTCSHLAFDRVVAPAITFAGLTTYASVTRSTITGDASNAGLGVPNWPGLANHDITFSENTLGGNAQRAVEVVGVTNLIISRNVITQSAGSNNAIGVFSSSQVSIDANKVAYSDASAIGLFNSGLSRNANVSVTNNFVYDANGAGMLLADADGLVVANNTVRQSAWYQFGQIQGTGNTGVIVNNLGFNFYIDPSSFTGTIDYNCMANGDNIGPHGLATPVNVDAAGKPSAGHPCIAKGTSAGAPAVSYNNVTRPGVVDVGAWQVTLLSGSGNAAVAVSIDPAISLTIASTSSCNGVTATGSSTANSVSLGRVNAGTNAVGAQSLSVGSNAANGFRVLISDTPGQSGRLSDGGSNYIAALGYTNDTPGSFPSPGTSAFGYTSDDSTLSGATPARFTSSAKWAGLESLGGEVAFAPAGTSTQTSCVGYQVAVSASQAAKSYSTTVRYTLVPLF